MATYTALIEITITQFNSIRSGSNIAYELNWADPTHPPANFLLSGQSLNITAKKGDTAQITFVLIDPNNLLVGAYFFDNKGGIVGQWEFNSLALAARGNPGQASSIVISDLLLIGGNAPRSFSYNFSILVQHSLVGSCERISDGNPDAIGIIDPEITAEVGE